MWLKDGEQIIVVDGYEIIMDGCRYILRIFFCEFEDDVEYIVMVGDLEFIINFYVEGRKLFSFFVFQSIDLNNFEFKL